MVNVVIIIGVVLNVDSESGSDLEVYYRNVKSVSKKQTELSDSVYYADFQIMCWNGTWLNDIYFYHKIFPISLTIVHSDTVNINKSIAVVLTAVPSKVGSYKCLYDLQYMTNCLVGNFHSKWPHFTDCQTLSTHNIKPDVISIYLSIFQKNLDTKNHSIPCLGISVFLTFTGWAVCLTNCHFIQN